MAARHKQAHAAEAAKGDVVWIFDSGADLDPVSVEIQRHYYDEWRQSFRSAGEQIVGRERRERVSQLE